MTTPQNNKATEAGQAKNKQKSQLVVLGALSAVLVLVLVFQLRGDGGGYSGVALASTAEGSDLESSAEDLAAEEERTEGKDNPVLSELREDEEDASNPFAPFWSNSVDQVEEAELAAPSVTLNATILSGEMPLALIDGRLHFEGDSIQGWSLAEIRSRAIVLQAPNSDTVMLEMPLLYGVVTVPENLAIQVPLAGSTTEFGDEAVSFSLDENQTDSLDELVAQDS